MARQCRSPAHINVCLRGYRPRHQGPAHVKRHVSTVLNVSRREGSRRRRTHRPAQQARVLPSGDLLRYRNATSSLMLSPFVRAVR